MFASQIVCFAIAILIIGCVLYSWRYAGSDDCTLEALQISALTARFIWVDGLSSVNYYFVPGDGGEPKTDVFSFNQEASKKDDPLIAEGVFMKDSINGYCQSRINSLFWYGINGDNATAGGQIFIKTGQKGKIKFNITVEGEKYSTYNFQST